MLRRLPGLHPRVETLSRFAEGELDGRRSRRVKRHLEACGRCRRVISRIREAERVLREIPVPSASPGVLERILARREQDIRTILPDGPTPPDRRRIPTAPVIGAIAAVLVLVFAVAVVSRASADSSALIIGEADTWRLVPVRYVPASYLANERVVRARARVWSSGFRREPTVVNQILRRDGNEFEGVIELPSDAAYARIAVENLDGDRIDMNHGRFWEVRDRELPLREVSSFAAEFRARAELVETGFVSYGDLHALSIEMTDAHPESPRIWDYRRSVEFEGDPDPDRRAETLAIHRHRVARWADAIRGRRPFAEAHLEDMLVYADNVGDAAAERIIAERLERLNPGSAALGEWRTLRALDGVADPAERLAIVAREWDRIGAANPALAQVGFFAARDLGNTELIDRWSDRFYLTEPSAWRMIIRELSDVPGIERKVSGWARERLAILDETDPLGAARPLHQSIDEFAARQDVERGRLLGHLAAAQLRLGIVGEGLEAAEASLRRVWDADMAARLLEELESTERGATRLASELRALLTADPLFEDPLPRGGAAPSPDAVERARADLASTILAGARVGRTPSRLTSPSREGADAVAPTLIVAFRRAPAEDASLVPELAAAATAVRRAGGRAAAIAPARDRDRLSRVASTAGLEELADPDALLDEFRIWHAWDYLVVDGDRYSAHHDLEEALRLTLLLSSRDG